MPSPYVTIHRLIRRLQQKNRFIGHVPYIGMTPVETHFMIELHADGDRSITGLSELLGIDQSFGSRVGQQLAERGLISIERAPDDARKKRLKITSAGLAAIRKADASANKLVAQFSAPLNADQRAQLVTLFRLIADGYGHPPGIRRSSESAYRVELRRVTRAFGLLGEHVFGSTLSSSSWQLLAEVVLTPVAPQPTELAGLLGLAQNSLSPIIKSMQRQSLIAKISSPTDRRSVTLKPREAGRHLYDEIESNAAGQIQHALTGVSAAQLKRYVDIFSVFVAERDGVLPPLSPQFQLLHAESAASKQNLRAFAVRELVAQSLEREIPERIFSERGICYGLTHDDKLVAAVELPAGRNTIGFGAWNSGVTPWLLLGFVGTVHRLATPAGQGFHSDFVQFSPLKTYLGL